MKLSKRFIKVPLLVALLVIVLGAATYFVVRSFGYNFDYTLAQTQRVEIKGSPEEINTVVQEIYSQVEIIDTEIGADQSGTQIQRLYFDNVGEDISEINDILTQNQNLTYNFSAVTPGFKTDFSSQLINFIILVCISFVVINITLFRRIFDYNYTFLMSLLNIFNVLINVALLLIIFSVMGKFGWHISNYTFNVFLAYIFSLLTLLSVVLLLFKESLGEVEYMANVGEHFKKFFTESRRSFVISYIVLVILLAPLFYFYQFRIEALIILFMGVVSILLLRVLYVPTLEWYDHIRLAHKKINKKKK